MYNNKCKKMDVYIGKKIEFWKRPAATTKPKGQCLNASIIFTKNWTLVLKTWIKYCQCFLPFCDFVWPFATEVFRSFYQIQQIHDKFSSEDILVKYLFWMMKNLIIWKPLESISKKQWYCQFYNFWKLLCGRIFMILPNVSICLRFSELFYVLLYIKKTFQN